MDKKNTIIGVVLLIAAFAIFMFGPHSAPPTQPANSQVATAPATTPAPNGSTAAPPAPAGEFAPINHDAASATVTTLDNDYIQARLTNFGGAIRDVAFKQYPAIQGKPQPYVFNHLHEDPILAFANYPGLDRNTRYDLVSATPTEVVYRTVLDGKIEVTRRYRLTNPKDPDGGDPYRLRSETTFRNLTTTAIPLPQAALSIGTATLVNSLDRGFYLNVALYDGKGFDYVDRGALQGGGIASLFGASRPPIPVLDKPGPIVWAAVKNQFFASIFAPDKPAVGAVIRRIELPAFADSNEPNIGLTGAERFDLPSLAPKGETTLGGYLYVGPKEYKRLAKFSKNEDGVMQYTRGIYRYFLSGYVAPLENTLMNLAHRWSGNWGVAVVLMTLMLKTISLPFTLAASRSARRMAKLQPELKVIREKYKDNPQKQQSATMELFKAHKVNPVGGCIPILITMPLFFGFYAMLAGAAELRFQGFLWAADLSAPDTVGHIFGFPINIMPLLMGVTTLVQMQLTPTPSVDNAQATMMKIMPVVFIAFCYNYSCALAIYMTINGLFTIGQQLVINRMRDTGDPADAAAAGKGPGGKPMKNVTPGKKVLKR
ncbi:MAG TPA: membrane protein insertase YidC [Opitutaceae bacterium]|nr:membrane protein insertase YidC [Opitutaceae bacterium]